MEAEGHSAAASRNAGGERKGTKDKMKKKIRVAIIGVGNCASSLVQGVECGKAGRGIRKLMLSGEHIYRWRSSG